MAYTTQARIRRLLGSPTDADLPTDLIALLLEREQAWIDGMLIHLYPQLATITAPYPPLLVKWTEDMAVYACLQHPEYRMRQPVDTAMIDQYRNLAVQNVQAASRRKMRIPGLDARDSTYSSTQDFARTFGVDEPESWKIDPGLLQKTKDSREL